MTQLLEGNLYRIVLPARGIDFASQFNYRNHTGGNT